jgi:hypothetical protein
MMSITWWWALLDDENDLMKTTWEEWFNKNDLMMKTTWWWKRFDDENDLMSMTWVDDEFKQRLKLWVHLNSWHSTLSMRQCLNRWWMMLHLLFRWSICRCSSSVNHVIKLATRGVASYLRTLVRTNTRISLENWNTFFWFISLKFLISLVSLLRLLVLIDYFLRSLHSFSNVQIDLINIDHRL